MCPLGSNRPLSVPDGKLASGGATKTTNWRLTPCDKGNACRGGVRYPCERGTFAQADGASTCAQCPAGRFSNHTGATECESAPRGFWSPLGASVPYECVRCDNSVLRTSSMLFVQRNGRKHHRNVILFCMSARRICAGRCIRV